jgi:hypothetical protein
VGEKVSPFAMVRHTASAYAARMPAPMRIARQPHPLHSAGCTRRRPRRVLPRGGAGPLSRTDPSACRSPAHQPQRLSGSHLLPLPPAEFD